MPQHLVKCRLCSRQFDTEVEEAVLVGEKSYYHKTCYEDWIKNRNNTGATGNDLFWKESLIDFLYRDVKVAINFSKLDNQWKYFTAPERKMTPKGIYFAVRYFYSVKNGSAEKAQGGIGIVPSIYKESCEYWTNLELKKRGTIDAIIAQIELRSARPVQKITIKESEKNKKTRWNLDDL